jgi:metallophosphoesterase superfamily enzyme
LAQAAKVTIKKGKSKPKKATDDWKLAALLPDTQIGYRVYEDGSVIEFHSEPAIDVALQIVAAAQEKYGVDVIVNLGDTLDLPAQSRHKQEIAFQNSTNLAIQRTYEYLAQQRAIAPDAEIVFLEGNHDCRINKYLTENAPAVAMMRRANDGVQGWPVNSLPHLLRMD